MRKFTPEIRKPYAPGVGAIYCAVNPPVGGFQEVLVLGKRRILENSRVIAVFVLFSDMTGG